MITLVIFFFIYSITNPVIQNQYFEYDALVILSGNPQRAITASTIYHEKKIKKIYLSKEKNILHNYIDDSRSIFTYELYLNILLTRNVPRDDILLFGTNNKSTYQEVLALSNSTVSNYKKILIITDKYHIFRAQKIFKKHLAGHQVDFFHQPVSNDWMSSKESIHIIFSETLKLILFYTFNDFENYLTYR